MRDRRHRQRGRRALKDHAAATTCTALGRRCQVFSRWFSGSGFLSRRTRSVHRASRQHYLHLHQIWRDLRASRARTRTRNCEPLFRPPNLGDALPARPHPAEQRLPARAVLLNGCGSRSTCAGVLVRAATTMCSNLRQRFAFHSSSARAPGPERIPRRRASRCHPSTFALFFLFLLRVRGGKAGGRGARDDEPSAVLRAVGGGDGRVRAAPVQLRKQFYPVVVHLGTSKLSVRSWATWCSWPR